MKSFAEALGKFAAVNIDVTGSLVCRPNVIDGTRFWLASHTSAWSIEPPNVTLCEPLIQVAASSMTLVDASRDVWLLPRPGFVSRNPVPQQLPLMFKR